MDAYQSALEILKATLNSITNNDLTKQELQLIVSNEESIENFTEIVKIFYASKSNTKAGNDVLRRFQEMQQLNRQFNTDFTYILKMLRYYQPFLNQKGEGLYIILLWIFIQQHIDYFISIHNLTVITTLFIVGCIFIVNCHSQSITFHVLNQFQFDNRLISRQYLENNYNNMLYILFWHNTYAYIHYFCLTILSLVLSK